jgi:PiT family inorganic phosphate transporter
MGVIAVLLAGGGYLEVGSDSDSLPVPEWVAVSAYAAIALGTVWGGWRIIETVGLRITSLNARTGVAANAGATTAIFGATALGIPISTTHAAASSVVGAGMASRRGTRWAVVGEMLIAWVFTIPATAAMAFVMVKLTRLTPVLSVPMVGAILVVLGSLGVRAMRRTIGAREVDDEVPPEDILAAEDAAVRGNAGAVPAV